MPNQSYFWAYSTNPSGSNKVDAIDFLTIQNDAILSGYRLWGVQSVNSTTFLVTMSLYGEKGLLIANETRTYPTSSSEKTFEVHFSQEIAISNNERYTAVVRIVTSELSYALDDGMPRARCSGVRVYFLTSSKYGNRSDISTGQIPALILLSKGSSAKR